MVLENDCFVSNNVNKRVNYLHETVVRNVKLTWKNVSVWIMKKKHFLFRFSTKKEFVQILNNVSGLAGSGTLLAIMGPSGAGKTTLLATISQRYFGIYYHYEFGDFINIFDAPGPVSGDIQINGRPVIRKVMRSISGYVPQEELVVGQLTVYEHLKFMARLKMDKDTKSVTRNEVINSLVNEFGLQTCINQKLKSLAGGELKRVSLIVQLLTNPLIVFCDEPTSGLDSYNAQIIVSKLEELANYGKVVICTIHQPTSGIFEKFHNVLLLADGRIAYNGPVDSATEYFANIGLRCPFGFNPAEFYVSQLVIHPDRQDACKAKIKKICDHFEVCKHSKNIKRHFVNGYIDRPTVLSLEKTYVEMSNSIDCFEKYVTLEKVNDYIQFCWLSWRSMLDMQRNYKDIFLRFILFMYIALLLSSPYSGVAKTVRTRDIQNLQGLMYLIITETVFTFCYSVFHTFSLEIPRLLREISNGLYNSFPFYLSKVLILIPLVFFQTLCYAAVIFCVAELRGGFAIFIWFYIPVLFCAISANAYGFFLSATFESLEMASLLSVPIDLIAMNYSGLYVNLNDIPYYLVWVPYTSQFFLGTEAISIVQWKEIAQIVCDNCTETGNDVLNKYGFYENNYLVDLLLLSVFCVTCHFIGFLALRARSRKQPVY